MVKVRVLFLSLLVSAVFLLPLLASAADYCPPLPVTYDVPQNCKCMVQNYGAKLECKTIRTLYGVPTPPCHSELFIAQGAQHGSRNGNHPWSSFPRRRGSRFLPLDSGSRVARPE